MAWPSTTPRRYYKAVEKPKPRGTLATVPTHLVVHARFETEAAVLPARGAKSTQKEAVTVETLLLDEEDHEFALQELERRRF